MKTVGQLINELQALGEDARSRPVVLSSDAEGNGFYFLQDIDVENNIDAHDHRAGYYVESIIHNETVAADELVLGQDYVPVVLLWP